MRYAEPAIIEALVDFVLPAPIDIQTVGRVTARLRERFPVYEDMREYNISINNDSGKASVQASRLGSRILSEDRKSVVIMRTNGCTIAKVGRYPGWPSLKTLATSVISTVALEQSDLRAARYGVKFINRIDVRPSEGRVPFPEYLKVYVNVEGNGLGAIDSFNLQIEMAALNAPGARTVVASNRVPSPGPTLASASLVIDTLRDKADIALEAIADELDPLADDATAAFEACITDKLRDWMKRA